MVNRIVVLGGGQIYLVKINSQGVALHQSMLYTVYELIERRNAMAYGYVVKGSEDGNIGVYGNKKRAIESAKIYVANASDVLDYEDKEYSIVSYCDGDNTEVRADWSWVSAEIEKFLIG